MHELKGSVSFEVAGVATSLNSSCLSMESSTSLRGAYEKDSKLAISNAPI